MGGEARCDATLQGHGPKNGDWEGYVYYASEDEGVEPGMHRVGAACEYKDSNGKHIAFEEYNAQGQKLSRPVLRSYLDRKRQDKRTQPMYVSAEQEIKLEYASTAAAAVYVGLPVGSDKNREAFLREKADEVISAVEKISALPDSEAQYRLLRYCATAWARYPASSMPTCGDGDFAMNAYTERVV